MAAVQEWGTFYSLRCTSFMELVFPVMYFALNLQLLTDVAITAARSKEEIACNFILGKKHRYHGQECGHLLAGLLPVEFRRRHHLVWGDLVLRLKKVVSCTICIPIESYECTCQAQNQYTLTLYKIIIKHDMYMGTYIFQIHHWCYYLQHR